MPPTDYIQEMHRPQQMALLVQYTVDRDGRIFRWVIHDTTKCVPVPCS